MRLMRLAMLKQRVAPELKSLIVGTYTYAVSILLRTRGKQLLRQL